MKTLLAGIAMLCLTGAPALACPENSRNDQRAQSETMIENSETVTMGVPRSRSETVVIDEQSAELETDGARDAPEAAADDILDRTHQALDRAEQGAGLDPENDGLLR